MNTSLLINDLISVLENVNKKGTESDDDKLISKIEYTMYYEALCDN